MMSGQALFTIAEVCDKGLYLNTARFLKNYIIQSS